MSRLSTRIDQTPLFQRPILYRVLAGLAVVLSIVLAARLPQQRLMRAPDPWAYKFAIQNLAQGRWTISDQEMSAGRMQTRLQGGQLTQYVLVSPHRWALEKGPGFPLLAIPFQWLGLAHLTNAALVVIAALLLYILIARQYSEPLAAAVMVLFSLAPMSWLALSTVWMDTFASGAVLVIGGSCYGLYLYSINQDRPRAVLAFFAGLMLGWSVLVRLSNLPIALLCGLHLLWHTWRRPHTRSTLRGLLTFLVGMALALSALIIYNQTVFGNPLSVGYAYSLYRITFAFGPVMGKPNVPVVALDPVVGAKLIVDNLTRIIQPWLIGFPLLLLAVPGWFVYRQRRSSAGVRFSPILSRWLLLGWLLAVLVPYVSFLWMGELLAQSANRELRFFEVDRYFFAWIFPMLVLASAMLARLPRWAALSFMAVYTVGAVWLYTRLL
ncbi:hypothetical protein TFLX_00473 [Thermoflexales bacterium]|nr:hypothetical protein TFLX_00473 [Thermoflexales bacterium]